MKGIKPCARGNPTSIFPTTILLATDGSEEAQLASTTAADLAEKTDSELHVLTVGPDYPLYGLPEHPAEFEDVLRENRRRAKEVLERQAERIEESEATVKKTHLLEGRADEEIGAGLIVMGSRGHGRLRRTLLGSVSDAVVRHAHCPVTIVRGSAQTTTFGEHALCYEVGCVGKKYRVLSRACLAAQRSRPSRDRSCSPPERRPDRPYRLTATTAMTATAPQIAPIRTPRVASPLHHSTPRLTNSVTTINTPMDNSTVAANLERILNPLATYYTSVWCA